MAEPSTPRFSSLPTTFVSGEATLTGFSGADIRVAISIPPNRSKQGSASGESSNYKTFAELQTITITSHRGVSSVRCLGESHVRETVRGSRTFGGTLIFSVLEKDVFKELYSEAITELSSPYPTFVDMLPPMTVTVQAVSEYGMHATMALFDVTLLNFGMTLSIDDIQTESTYTYTAKWVTPFVGSATHASLLETIKTGVQTVTPLSSRVTGAMKNTWGSTN